MSGIRIVGTGSAVPETILTNEDLSRTLDTSDEWIVRRTGIRRRHIASDTEGVHTLAIEAAEKAIAAAQGQDPGFSREKIAAVFAATMTASYVCPSTACILQEALGLPEDIAAFDISAACTGFLYALQTAGHFFAAGKKGYILLVGAECMSRLMDYTDRSCCVLFGDGAGAAVVAPDERAESCFYEIAGTKGSRKELSCLRQPQGDGFLHMDGQAVYRFASLSLRNAVEKLLDMAGLTLDDIDQVVCHQANARIIDSVKKRYPGHEDKFFMHMEEYANTSAASVALVLDDMYGKGLLKPGMRIIAAAFGAGLSWNAVLMTI